MHCFLFVLNERFEWKRTNLKSFTVHYSMYLGEPWILTLVHTEWTWAVFIPGLAPKKSFVDRVQRCQSHHLTSFHSSVLVSLMLSTRVNQCNMQWSFWSRASGEQAYHRLLLCIFLFPSHFSFSVI